MYFFKYIGAVFTSKMLKSKRICVISSDDLFKAMAQESLSVLGKGKPGLVNHPICAAERSSHTN